MTSLRKYITNQTELETYTGTLTSFDINELVRAERDIDNIVAYFFEGSNAKSYNGKSPVYTAVLTSTTATISDISATSEGYYNYCTLEIVSGSNREKRIAVQTSNGATLTFFDTQTGLDETSKVILYQTGKFPRIADSYGLDSVYYKTIPEFIKEAVALQYQYRINEGSGLEDEKVQTSYTVNRDSYSENFDNTKQKTTRDRISPQALDILESRGLTIQTL